MIASRVLNRAVYAVLPFALLVSTAPAQADAMADLKAWAEKMEQRIDLNLYQLGKEVELGRECGKTDATMPEHMEDLHALLAANDAALKSKTMSAAQRETLAPSPIAPDMFEEGLKATARTKFLTTAFGCSKLMVDWQEKTQKRAKEARHWRDVAQQLGAK
jgi:hypothetical protein